MLALKPKLAAEAEARKKALSGNRGTLTPTGVNLEHDPSSRTNAALAKIAGVGENTVYRMSKVQEENPKLFKKVVEGKDERGFAALRSHIGTTICNFTRR